MTIKEAHDKKEFLTGLLYVNENVEDFTTMMNVCDAPLATLPQEVIRPAKSVLDEIMAGLK
jgi:hypothetical protein